MVEKNKLDRLKEEIAKIIYSDILSGKLDINTPIGNLKSLSLKVNSVTDLGRVYQPFKTYEQSRQAYNYAMAGFESFK